ncbi:MAG TPA: vitamin K epoxide reductase family protein [Ktedonobacterales bacterium]
MDTAVPEQEPRGLARLLPIARTWPGLTAIVVMALAGLGVSIYLTIVHYDTHVTLACTKGGIVDCGQVTGSAWSLIPFTTIPITIPGMLWFVVSGGLALWGLRALTRGDLEPERERLALLIWSTVGLAFVLYLVYVEAFLVHKLCEWCTTVHIMTLAIFVIALLRWQRAQNARYEVETELVPTAPIRRPPPQALSRRAQAALRQRAGQPRGR